MCGLYHGELLVGTQGVEELGVEELGVGELGVGELGVGELSRGAEAERVCGHHVQAQQKLCIFFPCVG